MTEKDKEINELRREVARLQKALEEAEPKHGSWTVETDCEGKTRRCICNRCGFKTGRYTWGNPKYCENCGAKMEVEE